MGMCEVDRREKLNFAVGGLSFDLAVVQANCAIDRGLRGEEAMQAFRDEAALLLEEVTSSWRASCERLAVTFEDDTEEVKNLAQPFHRVRDDLRRLLHELPPASKPSQSQEQVPEQTKVYKTNFARNVDRLRKDCGWSFDDLAQATGLDKKLLLGHVNGGKGAHPSTLERYAQTFTEKLGRTITVAALES
jgi:hypothetical protein